MQVKPMIDVPQVEPLSNTTPMQMSYGAATSTVQQKNVSSNSIFQYENFQMKARLVTRKAYRKTNSKDQALNTSDQQHLHMKQQSASIAHIYELSASGAPTDMVKNTESPRKPQNITNSEIDSLEPK